MGVRRFRAGKKERFDYTKNVMTYTKIVYMVVGESGAKWRKNPDKKFKNNW
jgi:hypothetical protein